MTVFKKWLDFFGWSRAEAGRRLGISKRTVYRYVKEPRWNQVTLEQMSERIGVSPEQFLAGPGVKIPKPKPDEGIDESPVPEEGMVDIPLFNGVPRDFHSKTSETFRVSLKDGGPNRACVRVTQNGMSPRPHPGDVVLIDFGRTRPQSQDIVAVARGKQTTLARWVQVDRKPHLQWADQWCSGFPLDGEEYEILGIAIKIVEAKL